MASKDRQDIVTHIHSDHCSGALALRKRLRRQLGIIAPRKGYLGGEDFQYDDNDRISFGDGDLKVLHTPGTSPVMLVSTKAAIRCCQRDNILGYGTAVIHHPTAT